MKIITWNCNMAFRSKAEIVLKHNPDILIIPECEHPEKLVFPNNIPLPKDIKWFGRNRNKGLGIFSYTDYRFEVMDSYNENLRMIIPLHVSGGQFDFNLFAIWANNPEDPEGQYITQIWKAIHCYDSQITSTQTLLVGDFNSNTIWDRPGREGNHSTLVERLALKNIHSVYHRHFNQDQGKELDATLYMYRNKDKPYHIDYCFASDDLLKHLNNVEIGDYDTWINYSDHVPVIITFNSTLYKDFTKENI